MIDMVETQFSPEAKNSNRIGFVEGLGEERQQTFARIANACIEDMRLYLSSEAVPIEPTRLVVGDGSYKKSAYLGKFNDEHFVKISAPLERLADEDVQIETKYILAHELLHQRSAEIIGCKNMMGVDPDEQATALSLQFQTKKEAVDYLQGLIYSASPLSFILMEGIAVTGELVLLNKWIEQARLSKNLQQLETLTNLRANRLGLLRSEAKYTRDSWDSTDHYKNCYDPYSLGVLKFVKPLYDRFGLENMMKLFKSIDYQKCLQIEDVDEIKHILEDPRRIPGLENSPLVSSSFNNEQVIDDKLAA